VDRTPSNLDVFWEGPDGAIATQWWFGAPGFNFGDHQPFPITPPGAAAMTFLIAIDATRLSFQWFLIPGVTDGPTDARRVQVVQFVPGKYNYQFQSGVQVDFTFTVTPQGTVDYDTRYDAFLSGRGSVTLIVRGFPIAVDSTRLSHAILPVFGSSALKPDRINQLVLLPAAGYSFISASGVSADFTFGVQTDGTVVVDPRFAGFAQASGQTLTIKGYRITLDTQALSHALLPLLLDWAGGNLSPGRHDLTIVPGTSGYAFLFVDGTGRVLNFTLGTDSTITIKPSDTGVSASIAAPPRPRVSTPRR
jgi:hypothetical protein